MKDKAPKPSKPVHLQKAKDIIDKSLKAHTSMESETVQLIHELGANHGHEMQNGESTIAKEELYHTLFDCNRDSIAIYRINPDGKPSNFIDVNQAATELFGYTKQEFMSLTVVDLESFSTQTIEERIENILSNGKSDFESTITTKNGKTRNVEVKSLIIKYLNEPAVMNITRDITEYKQIENNSKKAHENLTTILEAIPDLMFEVGLDGKIYHYHSNQSDLLAVPPDAFLEKFFQDILPPAASKICMAAILEADEKGWSGGQQYSLDLAHGKHWFELSVSPIKDSYINDKHFIVFARNITDRKKAEEALRKSDEKIKSVFNLANSGILMVDKNGHFLLYNDWCCNMLGYSKEEFGKLSGSDITHPDDIEKSQEYLRKIIEGKINKYQIEKRYLRKDKSFFWGKLSVSTITDTNNNITNAIGVITDITERKQAESKLRNEKERIKTILELVGSPIFLKDNDHKITYANSAFYNLFCLTEKQVIGKTLTESVPEKEKNHFLKIDRNVLDTGIPDIREEELTVKGIEHTIITSKTRFIDAAGNKSLVGSIYEITERKKAESKLIDNEHFLNLTQTIANLGSYSLDFTTGKWTSSAVMDSIFGIDDNFEKSIEGWKMIIHPEWQKTMMDYLQNEVIAKKNEFNKNYKIIRINDKEERWVHGMGKIIFNELNEPLQLIGTIQDVSKQKNTEDSLRESEEKIRNLLDSTDGIVWEADATTFNFTFVSKQAERLLGFPVEEWYKEDFWKNHLHPDDKDKTLEYCISRTSQMKSHDFTYRFIANDGQVVWLRDIVNVVVIEGKPRWLRGVMFDISKQKKMEEALRESEEKYRSLVENSPDAVAIYIEGKIVFVNEEGIRMIGAVNKDEIIGKPVLQFIHPDSTESIIQRMIDVLRDSNASDIVEEKLIDLYGKPIDVELKAIPTLYEQQEAVQVIIHDISERKRTQEKIKQLSQAVEQSPVSIIITNTSGIIEYVNPKFTEISGYSFDEVVGQNPRVLKSGHTTQSEYKELWQTISAGHEWHGEFHNITKNGDLYWESASISPIISAQGKITHFIAIKEDITHRKKAQEELIHAKEKAEESDRLKLAFLANMSHEIRTPMNGILGFTELLKTPNLTSEEQQEYVKIIEKSGIRMLNIINDIISISKVESGQIETTLSETDINEQIEYLHTFFKPEAKQKGIQLIVKNTLPSNEAIINTDREKVYAILTNLVKNALKFTDSGSIEFGYVKKGKYLEFFIRDTGLGISNSQQKIIFERFRQANDTISRSHEGSGLGLAISKAYVEMLGGQIWVESQEGKGSCFYFTLPFGTKPVAKNTIVPPKIVVDEKTENEIKDLKVLIVEDDPISKLLITIAVKPYSKEILKVSTGFEAIEACRNNPDIDLVMMDINMPEMGGYEATKTIRQFNKDLIIIAQTANGMQSDRDEAIEAGCTDYISKPINIAALSDLIQKYFKK